MTTILTGKAITLKFATVEYHTQNEQAYITEEVDTENVETLGPDGGQVQVVFARRYILNLVALQDWTDADSLFALLNDAAQSGIDAEFELALTDAEGNVATATGTVQGVHGQFGGDKVLKGTLALRCSTYVPPVWVAGTP